MGLSSLLLRTLLVPTYEHTLYSSISLLLIVLYNMKPHSFAKVVGDTGQQIMSSAISAIPAPLYSLFLRHSLFSTS